MTASPGGLLFWALEGVLCGVITAMIFVHARTPVSRVVWGGFFALLTPFALVSLVARVLAARRNPEI